jgi:hypothetical protein
MRFFKPTATLLVCAIVLSTAAQARASELVWTGMPSDASASGSHFQIVKNDDSTYNFQECDSSLHCINKGGALSTNQLGEIYQANQSATNRAHILPALGIGALVVVLAVVLRGREELTDIFSSDPGGKAAKVAQHLFDNVTEWLQAVKDNSRNVSVALTETTAQSEAKIDKMLGEVTPDAGGQPPLGNSSAQP